MCIHVMRDAVRRTLFVWLFIVISGAIGSASQRGAEGASGGEQFLGTWVGTWEGSGSGGFELTLEKGKDGAVGGRVSVTGEPAYTATIKSLAFEGNTMTAKYDFPPNADGEVALVATFEGTSATGPWSLREKATGNEVASGTWKVTKK